MISRRRAWRMMILGMLVAFAAGVLLTVSLEGKVLVSRYQYREFQKLEKVLQLKTEISRDFYQEVDEDVLIEAMNRGTFEGLNDPYSNYYDKEEFARLMETTSGEYVGVGIIVSPGEDGLITVVAPIEDTPAEKAGVRSGDKILKVDDEVFSAKEMEEAVRKIKGTPGEKVKLAIARESETLEIEIVREKIHLKSVKSEMKGDVAYIRISNFDQKTGQEFEEHLEKMKKRMPKGIIIDLRDNPGGLLDQVKIVADNILGESTIVYTMDRKGKKRYLKSGTRGQLDIPLVVLVNGGSASASEILAGAVRDNKAGTLVGTTTFGKGLVQSVVELDDHSGYTLTTAQYFTPSGEYIHKKGITPDVVVEMPREDEGIEEKDIQLQKALAIINEKLK